MAVCGSAGWCGWPRAAAHPTVRVTLPVVSEALELSASAQFSLIAPRFAAYGVELWVPELGGQFDARNPSHKMLMSVLGGMSESERKLGCGPPWMLR